MKIGGFAGFLKEVLGKVFGRPTNRILFVD
jgi:hypothetical protein